MYASGLGITHVNYTYIWYPFAIFIHKKEIMEQPKQVLHTAITKVVSEENGKYLALFAGDVTLTLWVLYCHTLDPDFLKFLVHFSRIYVSTLTHEPLRKHEFLSLGIVVYMLDCIELSRLDIQDRPGQTGIYDTFKGYRSVLHERLEREVVRFEHSEFVEYPPIFDRGVNLYDTRFNALSTATVYAYLLLAEGVDFPNNAVGHVIYSNLNVIEIAFQYIVGIYIAALRKVHQQLFDASDCVFFITHVIYILSDYGVFSLTEVALPILHELVRKAVIQWLSISQRAPVSIVMLEVFGELMHCVSILGVVLDPDTFARATRLVSHGVRLREANDWSIHDRFRVPFCTIVGQPSAKLVRPPRKRDQLTDLAEYHFALL